MKNSKLKLIGKAIVATGILINSAAIAEIKITHKPIERVTSGERISINAKIADDGKPAKGIRLARAYFAAGEQEVKHFIQLNLDGEQYSGLLPAPDVQTESVNYQILVVNDEDEIVKSESFVISVKADFEAQARLAEQDPTDVHIDVSKLKNANALYKSFTNQKAKLLNSNGIVTSRAPTSLQRLEVFSEYAPNIDKVQVSGFNDYSNLRYVSPDKAYGVNGQVVDPSQSVASNGATTPGTYTGTVTTTAAGIGATTIIGGALVAGAAIGGGGGGGDNNSVAEDTESSTPSTDINGSFSSTLNEICEGISLTDSITVTVSNNTGVAVLPGHGAEIPLSFSGNNFSGSQSVFGCTYSVTGQVSGNSISGTWDEQCPELPCTGSF